MKKGRVFEKRTGFWKMIVFYIKRGFFKKSLRSKNRKVAKMIPLSRATVRMSTYERDNQKQKWYDEPIYICTTEPHIGDQIEVECRRRKIHHRCIPFVTERSTNKNKVRSEGYQDGYIYKIGIYDTELTRKQMADWAITTFNNDEKPFLSDDILGYMVWIQPEREIEQPIILSEEDYELNRATHWVK